MALFLAWKVRNVYDEFNESKVAAPSTTLKSWQGHPPVTVRAHSHRTGCATPLPPQPPSPRPRPTQAIFQSVVLVALSVSAVACCRGLLPASMSAVAYAITSFAILLVTTFIVCTMLVPKVVRRCARPQANTMGNAHCNTAMTSSGSITQILPDQDKVEEHDKDHEVLDKVGTVVLGW